MPEPWSVLTEAGVPLGPAHLRPPSAFDPTRVRAALEGIGEPSDDVQKEALLAWLCGFRHHWPATFEDVLGDSARRFEPHLHHGSDANRHLKLRRIAIENLSRLV